MEIYLQVAFCFCPIPHATAPCSSPIAAFHTWINAPVNITILLLPISPLLWYLSDKTKNRERISPWYWRAGGLILLLFVPTIVHLWSMVWDHPVFCSIPRQYSLLDRCWQIQCCKFKFPPPLPHKKDSFKRELQVLLDSWEPDKQHLRWVHVTSHQSLLMQNHTIMLSNLMQFKLKVIFEVLLLWLKTWLR